MSPFRITYIWGILFLLLSGSGLAQEICDNCIDDDNDGFIDCYDPECCGIGPCSDFFFDCGPIEIVECNEVPPITIKQLWRNNIGIDTRRTPVVGDIDNDGINEVLLVGSGNQGIIIVDGVTGVTQQILAFNAEGFFDSPSILDIDQDGYAEIFAINNLAELWRWEYDPGSNSFIPSTSVIGTTWVSNPTIGYGLNSGYNWVVSLIDFNYDGQIELVLGNQIYNAHTGAKIAQPPGGLTDPFGMSYNTAGVTLSEAYPAFADVLPDAYCLNCSGVELVCGPVVYSVDVLTGIMIPEVDMRPTNSKIHDGPTSLGDWDGDGLLDVAVNGCNGIETLLYVYDPRTGTTLAGPLNNVNGAISPSHPSLGDVDNDGELELACAGSNGFWVLDNDFSVLWQKTSNDGSSKTTASLYDLNGDLIYELIYLDEDGLHIWDASTGDVHEFVPCGSGTRTNYPIIVDVNQDGEANIVCSCRDGTPFPPGKADLGFLRAYSSDEFPWIGSRKLMNQHSYFVTNVSDELTICGELQNTAISPRLNQYLSQSTFYDGDIGDPVPEMYFSQIQAEVFCTESAYRVEVAIELCNQGNNILPIGAPVSLYQDEVTASSWLKTLYTKQSLDSGDCELLYDTLFLNQNITLHLAINDLATPPDGTLDLFVLECDTLNNRDSLDIDLPNPSIALWADSTLCPEDATGKAGILSTTDLVAPLNFVWNSDVALTNDTLWANSGWQYVEVTDSLACSVIDSIEIFSPEPLQNIPIIENASCDLSELGSVINRPSGGTPSYLFILNSDTFTTAHIQQLDTGYYHLETQDMNECSTDTSWFISFPGNTPPITFIPPTDFCLNDTLKTLQTVENNGYWSSSFNIDSVTGEIRPYSLPSGILEFYYHVDSICPNTDTLFIENHDSLILIPDTFYLACFGNTNGDLEPVISGGVGPIAFEWEHDIALDSGHAFNLGKGAFGLTITDSIGCRHFGLSAVVEPNQLQISLDTITNDSCYQKCSASIRLKAVGGNSEDPYLFYLQPGYETPTPQPEFAQLCAGDYWGFVQDKNGCLDSLFVQITQPDPLGWEIQAQNTRCSQNNGSIAIENIFGGTPPFNIEWEAGSNELVRNGLSPGPYSVLLTDSLGCTKDSSWTILQSPDLLVKDSVVDLTCNANGSGKAYLQVLDGTPPYTYFWENHPTETDSFLLNLAAGWQSYRVSDADNCSLYDSVNLQEPTPVLLDPITDTILCSYDSLFNQYRASGGWGGPLSYYRNETLVPGDFEWLNQDGSHRVQAFDVQGCPSEIDTFSIAHRGAVTGVVEVKATTCSLNNGELEIRSIVGGLPPYSINWDNGSSAYTQLGLDSGWYHLRLEDKDACWDTSSYYLEPSLPLDFSTQLTHLTCFEDQSGGMEVNTFQGTPPFLFQVNSGPLTSDSLFTLLSAGSYAIEVLDSNGCFKQDTIQLNQPSPVRTQLRSDTTLCFGDSLEVRMEASGGNGPTYTFELDGLASPSQVWLHPPNTYSVQAFDIWGCPGDTAHLTIGALDPLSLAALPNDTVCMGGSLHLNPTATGGSGMYQWHWSNGISTWVNNLPMPSMSYGDRQILDFQLIDTQCTDTLEESASLTYFPYPEFNFEVSPLSGCVPLDVSARFSSPEITDAVWRLDPSPLGFGPIVPGQQFKLEQPGQYQAYFRGKTMDGCTAGDTLPIQAYPLPAGFIELQPQRPSFLFPQSDIQLVPTAPVSTVDWNIEHSKQIIHQEWNSFAFPFTFPEVGGYFHITAFMLNSFGCRAETNHLFKLNPESGFYIPNTITPNGDGTNETFSVKSFGVSEEHFEVLIFDRWGELIYQSNDLAFEWDATYKGHLVQLGVYVWKITYEDLIGDRKQIFGHVNVIR